MPSLTFSDFGFSAPVLEALARKGFEEPTPIQSLAIPVLLSGSSHLVARARTGTGKTAAFGLPLVERLSTPGPKVRALVLVPTRELAVQVSGEIASFAPGPAPRIATVYGGASMGEQLRRLSRGVDIVVGTPGRVLDHLDRKTLDLSALEWLVLDEADEMLDMGFIEDIEKVMDAS
ncbi:MAG TPA: DEAD/DEAH box helicase, partial [Spirochaetales bacterium]|nr:DEAD/DEAH box helicase [Spirochaetales bacterium]